MELQLHVSVAVKESPWSSNLFDTLLAFAKGTVRMTIHTKGPLCISKPYLWPILHNLFSGTKNDMHYRDTIFLDSAVRQID